MARMKSLYTDIQNAQREIEDILAELESRWGIDVERIDIDEGVKIITPLHETD